LSKNEGGISARSAAAVLEMHAEGATVPFMARYRKDKTGQLDENQIRSVIQRFEEYEEIKKRKSFILKEVGEQGNLTSALSSRIELCWDLGELEEIYRPFKKKKKTKATIAREAGLGVFADWLWELGHGSKQESVSIEVKAKDFLNVAAGFASYDLVIAGAKDILTEQIANDPSLRELVLKNFMEKGRLSSERSKDFKPHSKYEMYAKYEESVRALMETRASHRYLAVRRGWQEGELSLKIVGDEDLLLKRYEEFATQHPDSPAGEILKACAKSALTLYVTCIAS
jgi:uncharacterized protein